MVRRPRASCRAHLRMVTVLGLLVSCLTMELNAATVGQRGQEFAADLVRGRPGHEPAPLARLLKPLPRPVSPWRQILASSLVRDDSAVEGRLAYSAPATLAWHTFIGQYADDCLFGITLDNTGNIYVTGRAGVDFGLPRPIRTFSGQEDIFVAKLNSDGELEWHTYLGGSGSGAGAFVAKRGPDGELVWNTFLGDPDRGVAFGMTRSSSGDILLVGYAVFGDWGKPADPDGLGSEEGVLLASLHPDGQLAWHRVFGNGYAVEVVISAEGDLFIAGVSDASWGTPLHSFSGGSDCFVARLTADGRLDWLTFFGSEGNEDAWALACDGRNRLFVAGRARGSWGDPRRRYSGRTECDAFVATLSTDGQPLWYAFLGSADAAIAYAVAVDGGGNLFIAGSGDASRGEPLRAFAGGRDGFLVKLDPGGNLVWHTFLGGLGADEARGLALAPEGALYVAGFSDQALGAPIEPQRGSRSGFVARLASSGELDWLTFLGGQGSPTIEDIALDGTGMLHPGTATAGEAHSLYVVGQSDASWGRPLRSFSGAGDSFGAALDHLRNAYLVGTSDQPWGQPLRAHSGGADAFVAMLDVAGQLA